MDGLSSLIRIILSIFSSLTVFGLLLGFILSLTIAYAVASYFRTESKNRSQKTNKTINVAFFHPYCNAGGGGERVLWCAIRALQERYPDVQCAIYTGDAATEKEILEKAYDRFGIRLPRDVKFIFLQKRDWLEAKYYPVCTLMGQSLGTKYFANEAINAGFYPDIFIDTMGYAFAFSSFKNQFDCKVACYVHYPTISTDMLQRVAERTEAQNNRQFIAKSRVLSRLKLLYYHIFAYLYGRAGRNADVVMVNSSWTKNHIVSLWKEPRKVSLVYPPCNVKEFQKIAESKEREANETIKILSIAQFRPEKDHQLQVRAFALLAKMMPSVKIQLVLAGSCRNDEDQERVVQLQQLCKDLGHEDSVVFKINVSFQDLLKEMSESLIGIHTMWNEHFGIGIVECMAAGLIMVAHDSGGPKLDIVTDFEGRPTGFLAASVEEYALQMRKILCMTSEELEDIRKNARKSVERFSDEMFSKHFLEAVQPLFSRGSL